MSVDQFKPQPGQTYTASVQAVEARDAGGGAPMLQVQIHALQAPGGDAPSWWARVAVPFAGGNRGSFFIPDVGDEVLVTFVDGQSERPVVIGSLWNGTDTPPEELGSNGVDRWSIVSDQGSRIAINEESSPTITVETPMGNHVTISDADNSVTIEASGNTVVIDPGAVAVTSAGQVTVDASTVTISAGMVTVNSGMADFSGVVRCSTLITNSVVSSSYTPGAGNVW